MRVDQLPILEDSIPGDGPGGIVWYLRLSARTGRQWRLAGFRIDRDTDRAGATNSDYGGRRSTTIAIDDGHSHSDKYDGAVPNGISHDRNRYCYCYCDCYFVTDTTAQPNTCAATLAYCSNCYTNC